jgi:hypothetical protein
VKLRQLWAVGFLAAILLAFAMLSMMRGESISFADRAILNSELLSDACQPIPGQGASPTPDLLKQQGKKLRLCIEKAYQHPEEIISLSSDRTHSLHRHGFHSIDSAVAPFFPLGTSFDDAAIVLESAGFSISKPGEGPKYNNQYYSCLTGGKKIHAAIVSSADVGIEACPRVEGNLASGVGEVKAQIVTHEL